MGRATATRAAIDQAYNYGTIGNASNTTTGVTDLRFAQFGVFAYFTGAKTYVEDAKTKAPNFMFNEHLWWDGTSTSDLNGGKGWEYSPVKYWPNGIDADNASTPSNTATQAQAGMLSFFAFAPYMEQTTTNTLVGTAPTSVTAKDVKTPKTITIGGSEVNNGVVAISDNASPTDVWVKYVMPSANANEAVDLLWGLAGKDTYKETDASDPTLTIGENYNVNLTKQIVSEKVKFLFKHALAKVGGATTTVAESTTGNPTQCGFKVVADIDANETTSPKTQGANSQKTYFTKDFDVKKTLITLKEVSIRDGKSAAEAGVTTSTTTSTLNTFGWFDIETGSWSTESGTYGRETDGATYNVTANNTDADVTNSTYTLNEDIREPDSGESGNAISNPDNDWSSINTGDSKTLKATGVDTGTNLKNVFANENVPGLLIIPGGNQEIYVTVDYIVRTADSKLASGYSEVEQVITNKVSLSSLQPNKYYTIIMHLGLTSVKFEAAVTDWTLQDGSTFATDGTVTESGNSNAEPIWLPSNVVTGIDISVQALTVTIDNPETAIPADGGDSNQKTLTVKLGDDIIDAAKYTVITGASWLSYSAGKLIAAENEDTVNSRSTTVTVSYKDDSNVIHTGTVVVTQAKKTT